MGFVQTCPCCFSVLVDLGGGNFCMVLIGGPLDNDLSVVHGDNTSFMYKSLWTRRQMVHINSPHNVPGLPNLIHGTDEGINDGSRNTRTLRVPYSNSMGLATKHGL